MKLPFTLARRAPWLLNPLFAAAARNVRRDPEAAATRLARSAPPVDREALHDPRLWELHVRTTAEAINAPAWFAWEARLLARAWDIDLAAIRAPAALWVGERDATHPPAMSRRLAERLGGAPVHVVPEAGTFGLVASYPEVLAFAAAAPAPAAPGPT